MAAAALLASCNRIPCNLIVNHISNQAGSEGHQLSNCQQAIFGGCHSQESPQKSSFLLTLVGERPEMVTDERGWGQEAESTGLWLPNNDRGEGLGSFRPLAMLGEPRSCSRKVAAVHVLMTSRGCESGVFPGAGSPGEETEEFYFLNHWLSGRHTCHLV